MQINTESIAFLLTLSSFCGGSLLVVWKTSSSVSKMKTDLEKSISESNHDSEKKDLKLEGLQDRLVLGFNGFRERFEHFNTRYKNEHAEMNHRVQDIEQYLTKEFKFERRR